MSKKIYLISVLVFLCDQISKVIISSFLELNKSIKVINDFFYLTSINNSGASWGILSNQRYLLVILSIIAIIVILRYINTFKKTKFNIIGFGILLGGIVGNLSDRLFFGYVRDFIDIYIFNYNFPIFNIADICIVVGVIMLIISILRGEDKNGSSSK